MFNALLKLVNQQKQKNKKGFTLVELIVVIAILGILAALVVPSVTGYIQKAQDATNQANAQMLYSAAQLYVTDMDVAGTAVGTVTTEDLVKNGYIQKAPDGTANFTIVPASDSGETYQKTRVTLTYTPKKGNTTAIVLGEQEKTPSGGGK